MAAYFPLRTLLLISDFGSNDSVCYWHNTIICEGIPFRDRIRARCEEPGLGLLAPDPHPHVDQQWHQRFLG